jgi:hypothetical protein
MSGRTLFIFRGRIQRGVTEEGLDDRVREASGGEQAESLGAAFGLERADQAALGERCEGGFLRVCAQFLLRSGEGGAGESFGDAVELELAENPCRAQAAVTQERERSVLRESGVVHVSPADEALEDGLLNIGWDALALQGLEDLLAAPRAGLEEAEGRLQRRVEIAQARSWKCWRTGKTRSNRREMP